jgi:hypothetical protein
MARWILILGLVLGFWMGEYEFDGGDLFGAPKVAVPDVQVMDGADPFPPG